MFDIFCVFFAIRMVNLWRRYVQKLLNIILARFELITFRFAYGDPQNPHLYDFGTFGRVPEPQNQFCLSLETPGYLNKIEKILNH